MALSNNPLVNFLGYPELAEKILIYLDSDDVLALASTCTSVHIVVCSSETCRACRPLSRAQIQRLRCTDLILHPRLSNCGRRTIYANYLDAVSKSRKEALWLTELLCLRLPADILEHHIFPILVEIAQPRVEVEYHMSEFHWDGRVFRSNSNDKDSLTRLLQSSLEGTILAKLVDAGSTPSLSAILRSQNKTVQSCLIAGLGKTLMATCPVSIESHFRSNGQHAIPSALQDYTNIIRNLELTVHLPHCTTRAAYCYPVNLFRARDGAKDIHQSFPYLKTLKFTVLEPQMLRSHISSPGSIQYTTHRPTFNTFSAMLVPGALPAVHDTTLVELVTTLATNVNEVKGLLETSAVLVEQRPGNGVYDGWTEVRSAWRNGIKE